jgi:protoporphyrinogen oxidase
MLNEPVSNYYWVTVAEPNAPFVLYIEHTNLVKDDNYGRQIVYLSRYLDNADPLYAASDDEIKKVFLKYLKKMFQHFRDEIIKESCIFRSEYSQPVVTLRHSKNILPFETPIENLYLASMAQIYPEDRGQNYAVRMGGMVAEEMQC